MIAALKVVASIGAHPRKPWGGKMGKGQRRASATESGWKEVLERGEPFGKVPRLAGLADGTKVKRVPGTGWGICVFSGHLPALERNRSPRLPAA